MAVEAHQVWHNRHLWPGVKKHQFTEARPQDTRVCANGTWGRDGATMQASRGKDGGERWGEPKEPTSEPSPEHRAPELFLCPAPHPTDLVPAIAPILAAAQTQSQTHTPSPSAHPGLSRGPWHGALLGRSAGRMGGLTAMRAAARAAQGPRPKAETLRTAQSALLQGAEHGRPVIVCSKRVTAEGPEAHTRPPSKGPRDQARWPWPGPASAAAGESRCTEAEP
mmetsp:Transcript_85682/g.143062  ORF Transcript_85682/g.143062 Transcript_85682/m.143062 type:complete len:223 (+) Transcript_85682:215-883(+)